MKTTLAILLGAVLRVVVIVLASLGAYRLLDNYVADPRPYEQLIACGFVLCILAVVGRALVRCQMAIPNPSSFWDYVVGLFVAVSAVIMRENTSVAYWLSDVASIVGCIVFVHFERKCALRQSCGSNDSTDGSDGHSQDR